MNGIFLSLALMAADPAAAPPPSPAAAADKECRNTTPGPDTDEIIVCAERQEGYRIDPDILEASRGSKQRGQRPKIIDNSTRAPTLCEHIGGCSAMESLNIVNTAIVAAQMVARAAQGESVANMFKTRPEASEYEIYLEAKREREAREALDAAAAAEAAAKVASKVDGD